MSKIEIEKNRLDLSYQRQLQLINFILIGGAGGVISLIIGLVLNPEKLVKYSIYYGISFIIIAIILYVVYIKLNENLKNISDKLKNLQ